MNTFYISGSLFLIGGGGGEGYVAQRHVFSEGVYSQSSHNVTEGWEGVEKWQKKRHVFSERPLAPFRRSSSYLFDASSYCLTRLPNFEPHYSG